MKTKHLMLLALLPLVLVACGDEVNNAPPPSAMTPSSAPVTPKKPPSTIDEKIKAIEAAPISEDEKKKAIERVRSGSL